MAVDNDLKAHQDTWNHFIKGSMWVGGLSALVLALMAIFVA